jgi:alanyl-tRNA synthetase
LKSAELREKYLAFFESKGCKRWPSSSLIPDDPSMLLTSAGMVQFKPWFLQQKQLEEPWIGTTTVQKCVRTTDIDIIGTTGRHLSFFEMLGNFSFGAYFKKEMCAWAYEFSTEVLGFDPERLYFTVFVDDDETIEIWKDLGVPESHISKLGADDNFWLAGDTGPCGPCSELYYDQGPEYGCGKPDCAPGCDCDRFLEYWNCVFTQFDRQEDGSMVPLPKKNIDTGMGLERTAAILQGVQSNYDTDILRGLITLGEQLSGKSYRGFVYEGGSGTAGTAGSSDGSAGAGTTADSAAGNTAADNATATEQDRIDLALRICADHGRAVTFMIADGILPSNEGRGFVLRRLLRRAMRYGQLIGIEPPFLGHYVQAVIQEMAGPYPELRENQALVERIVKAEEERFAATLRTGQAYLDQQLAEVTDGQLSGQEAFVLHDRYGFPIDLTVEIAAEQGIDVDRSGFELHMNEQRERARAAAKDDAWGTIGGVFSDILRTQGATAFLGYSERAIEATVQAIVIEADNATGEAGFVSVSEIADGQRAQVVLDRTPFYGEMGGQVGDTGTLTVLGNASVFNVEDTQVYDKAVYAHVGTIDGSLKVGDKVLASIDSLRRERIERNHTATHLLHHALREVLGEHVKQAGSLVAPQRLRFDFTHFEAMSPSEIAATERIVNDLVMEDGQVSAWETSLDEARASGVTALFGEKYGEKVRVLAAGEHSRELCGGTHVHHTAQIGFMKIISESSVGANLRRIEAVTSFDALEYVNRLEAELKKAAALLKAPPLELSEKVEAQQNQLRELENQARAARASALSGGAAQLLDAAITAGAGYQLVVARLDGQDVDGLRNIWDNLRDRLAAAGQGAAAVLGGVTPAGSPLLLAAGNDAAVAAGFNAGATIKQIAPLIQGGGGGKPQMAQAGGKDAAGLDAALAAAREACA